MRNTCNNSTASLRPCCRYMGVSSAHPSHEYDPVAAGASTLLPTPLASRNGSLPAELTLHAAAARGLHGIAAQGLNGTLGSVGLERGPGGLGLRQLGLGGLDAAGAATFEPQLQVQKAGPGVLHGDVSDGVQASEGPEQDEAGATTATTAATAAETTAAAGQPGAQDQQDPQQQAADQQHQPRCGSPSRLAANLRKHSDEIHKMQVGVAGGSGVGWIGQVQGGWVWQEGQAQGVERRWVWQEGQVQGE